MGKLAMDLLFLKEIRMEEILIDFPIPKDSWGCLQMLQKICNSKRRLFTNIRKEAGIVYKCYKRFAIPKVDCLQML